MNHTRTRKLLQFLVIREASFFLYTNNFLFVKMNLKRTFVFQWKREIAFNPSLQEKQQKNMDVMCACVCAYRIIMINYKLVFATILSACFFD